MYHLTVMPCFDKKLEASRSDFTIAGTSIRETDCVISTGRLRQNLFSFFPKSVYFLLAEFEELMLNFGISLNDASLLTSEDE